MSQHQIAKLPPVVAGENVLSQLPNYLGSWQANAVLLVSDRGVKSTGLVAKVQAYLDDKLPVFEFIAPAGEPSAETVNQGAELARQLTNPIVIGIGGGTALDIAKLIAGMCVSKQPIQHYLLCANPWLGSAPKIMIPTTSGTGAEVTRTCVISDNKGNKSWAWGDELSPELVLLDPQSTQSMPAHITAATGLDAFVHAIEAATAQKRNHLADASALQAISLVDKSLAQVVQQPANLRARLQMQEAAYLAGIAIDNCGTGIAHCIGHALGTLYHIPHGVAVSLGLAASLPWSIQAAPACYQAVADRLGLNIQALPDYFQSLLVSANFASCLGKCPAQLNIAKLAACMQSDENKPMAENNSRIPNAQDFTLLANQAQQTLSPLLAA